MGLAVPAGFFVSTAEFSPLDLSPVIWLDASDASTLYDATSGGSLVAADGSVARINDKSGNGRDFTQSTSGSRPTRKTSIQNSLDILRFDGSNDYMASSAFVDALDSEIHAVFIPRASQTGGVVSRGSSYQTPFPGARYLFQSSLKIETSLNGNTVPGPTDKLSQRLTSSNVVAVGTAVCVSQRVGTTHAAHVIAINGVDVSVSSPFSSNPGSFTPASASYGLGAYSGGAFPTQIDFCELVVTPALSTDDRTELMTHLKTKWGIA